MKKSLRNFDPDRVARLESEMWKAYYYHRFIRLFYLLSKLIKEFFGFSYLNALRPAYYAAIAAIDFRLNKGKETHEVQGRILRNLTKFYRIIHNNCLEDFDPKKVAQLELEWWLIDRYPAKYEISREWGLAAAMSAIFDVEQSTLSSYASSRAEAMVLCDKIEGKKDLQVDWEKVGNLLKNSYQSLYLSVR